jgi:hypothetical protein
VDQLELFESETHHMVDDACVDDYVKDQNWLKLSLEERKEADLIDLMQQSAIDTYNQVLEETGSETLAEKAFFKIHRDFYAGNDK